MPRRVQGPDGVIHEFPDDATDAEIVAVLEGGASSQLKEPQAQSRVEQAGMPPIMDVGAGVLKGVAKSALNVGDLVVNNPLVGPLVDKAYQAAGVESNPETRAKGMDWLRSYLKPTNTEQMIGEVGETAAELAAPVAAGARVAMKALPNLARAQEGFQAVMKAVGGEPISVAKAANVAQRIEEYASRGAYKPKVVSDFLKRVSAPGGGSVSFAEARDFAQNASRLSAAESMKTKGTMKALISEFAAELDHSLRSTAKAGGVGDEYAAAMKEYRNAKQLESAGDALLHGAKSKAGIATAGAVGGGATAYLIGKMKGMIP